MPVRAKKTVGTKRRKKRTTATKSATARKKTTTKRRKKRASTAHSATPRRRRKTKVDARKTATKRPRKKTKTAVRRKVKTATRRGLKKKVTSRVKKKPSESKTSKEASSPSRFKASRKLRTLKRAKKTENQKARPILAFSKKKQKQAKSKSDSQALPVVKQEPLTETKMTESKKPKKSNKEERYLPETRLESPSTHLEVDLNIAPYKERPGEDYMNPGQKAYFRRILLQKKRILLEEMGRTVHHLQDEGASYPDIIDRATQEGEFSLVLRARDRECKLIKKIEDALQQLDEGSYGYCHSCGAQIGIPRLQARPMATLCIECKTCDEIREKQMGG